jgi:signal transduction histidine kinase/phage shock protein PspC (stress-responsive transcriptional regulator)
MRVDPELTLTAPRTTARSVFTRAAVGQDGLVQTAFEVGGPHAGRPAHARQRPPLVRQRDGRFIGGVAAGLAVHLGLPVKLVRIAFVALSFPFGAGVAAYVFLWATMRLARPGDPRVPSAAVPTPDSLRRWLRTENQPIIFALLGIAALALAAALWLTGTGINLHAEIVVPVVAIAVGTIFFWSQLDTTAEAGGRPRVRWLWLVVGLGLTTLGLVGLVVRGTDLAQVWQIAGAVLAALVGVLVLAAPWALRLWSNLREEQTARIRATERADIAAHLHDSVLQTLALIQRQSYDASTVARLARAQERQLRSYLYDQDARADSLGAAVTAAVSEVEDLHGVPVQLVVTGDRPMDEHLEALVKALREATWNAVRHGLPPVTAYVEVGPTKVEAFVRDHGAGFDLDAVPDDRAGVRSSIIGRMERHGGTASIRRRDDGTEIELCLPVAVPAPTTPPNGNPEHSTQQETTQA